MPHVDPTLAYSDLPPGGRITFEQRPDGITITVARPPLWRVLRAHVPGVLFCAFLTVLPLVSQIGRTGRWRARMTGLALFTFFTILAAVISALRSYEFTVSGDTLTVRQSMQLGSPAVWARDHIRYVRARWGGLNVRSKARGHAWISLMSPSERAWVARKLTEALHLPS